ncbi:MAG: hypothetical protein EBT86_09635 [Actinobacteria bacterium]|nr:hypothetical protein [Actinomycetota bacterium]
MALKLYYHIYTSSDALVNQWLIDDQLKILQWFNVPDNMECYCTISGYNVFPALDLVNKHRSWMKVLEWEENDPHGEFEGRTIKYLWRHAEPEDKIFYFHTKGISFLSRYRNWGEGQHSFGARNVKALVGWRKAMEHCLIEHWPNRVNDLDRCHTQGCYYLEDPFPHYMGNFWWARGDHIRTLPNPFDFHIRPYPTQAMQECIPERIRYEQWLFYNPAYHLPVRSWPWHVKPEDREPGYSPGVNPYEDDFTEIT